MGTWVGNNIIVGGRNSWIRIESQYAGSNQGGNYSTVNYQVWYDFFGNDAQLDGGWVESSAGVHYNNGGRVYNFANNFTNHSVLINNGSFNIGHDAAGNASYGMNAHIGVFQSGTSTASGSEGLPNIPRFAAITALYASPVTDVGFQINVNTDVACNFLQISLEDGVGWRDITGATFTAWSQGVGVGGLLGVQLPSNTSYNFRARVRRADSGQWSESGVASVTTGAQAGFIDIM